MMTEEFEVKLDFTSTKRVTSTTHYKQNNEGFP